MLDGTYYIECGCHSDEHVLRFTLDLEPGEEEIYTSVFLQPTWPWYKRTWQGIKYIFGYTSKYGHFDCTTIYPNEAEKLNAMLNTFLEKVESNKDYNPIKVEFNKASKDKWMT